MDHNADNAQQGSVGSTENTNPEQAAISPGEIEDMSRLLPDAVALASRQSGRLAEALRPGVVRALRITAQDDPRVLVEALFRVVVPAFVRAFAERIHSGVLRLNHFLLRNASIHGWRWRLEALRTGHPLREIVRQHTTSKRVKQVFLIHRETGLLLASARQENMTPLDGDMISAMLTAIQDFVQDSFGVPRRSGLEHIQVGRTQVWIEQGEQAVLAGIVEGQATAELRELFHECLLRIHSDFQSALRRFEGDVKVFEPATLFLESCVNARLTETGERILPVTWLAILIPFVLLAGLTGMHVRDALIWRGYVQTIATQPGIVVLESGVHRGRFYIRGLRDPLALDPAAMLPAVTIRRDAVDSEWSSYQALIPEWTNVRARQLLNPPDTVVIDVEGSTLRLEGAAPGTWIDDARRLSRFLPGVTHLDTSRLLDRDQQAKSAWTRYLERLRSEPGLVVTDAGHADDRFRISGLRDSAAADPAVLLEEFGLDPDQVNSWWEPYEAPLPRFALARARRILEPPASTVLKVEGDLLVVEGEAPHRWIREARLLVRGIEGISGFDIEHLVDTDMSRLMDLKRKTESMLFRFLDRSTELWPGQARQIKQLAERLEALGRMGRQMGVDVFVELRGHVSDARDEDMAHAESLVIAERLADILQRQDVDMRLVLSRGLGNEVPEIEDLKPEQMPRRAVTILVSIVQH